jgi:hypothetical protein
MKSKWSIEGFIRSVTVMARRLFHTVLVVTLSVSVFAKMYDEPRSFSMKDKFQDRIDRKVLPKIDTERLLEEDRANSKNPQRPGPFRFPVAADVSYTLDNSGTWENLSDGRLRRLLATRPRFQYPAE